MKLGEVRGSTRVAALGDSGTGKTRLVGLLCALVPTVVVTADPEGLDTLVGMGAIPAEVVLLQDWDNIWDYHGAILASLKNGAKAVALDDFGAAQREMRRKIELQARSFSEEKLATPAREEMIRQQLLQGDRKLLLQHYGELAGAAENWLYEFIRLPAPLKLMTMLTEVRDNPRSGEDYLFPNLMGNIRYDILALFSLVLNTFIAYREGKAHFAITSRPHPRIATKDRYGVPRTWAGDFRDPTMERIYLHILRQEGDSDRETALELAIGVGLEDKAKGVTT